MNPLFYFDDSGNWDNRLKIIEGDMTDNACLAGIPPVDTVINCAAKARRENHASGQPDPFNQSSSKG